MKKLSPKGVALLGAMLAYSATVIAQDAQIGDLRAIAGSVKDLATPKERASVVTAYTKLATGKLAEGMALDGLDDIVAKVADADTGIPPAAGAMDGDFASQLVALLGANGMTPEVIAQIQSLCSGGAMDAEPDDKKDEKVDKPAMDAAIAAAVKTTTANMLAVRTAEIEVQPVIGNLAVAQDSAAGVYKLALDHMKVDLTDVDPSAYRAMFRAVQGMGATDPKPALIAQDSAQGGAKTFAEMFPAANPVKGS